MATWQSECMTMIKGMHSGADNAWNDVASPQVYRVVIDGIGEEWSRKAVTYAVYHNKWRPSPAELRDIALTISSILPTEGSLNTEIYHKACGYGYEVPNFTHPFCELIVHHMGAWQEVRSVHWHLDFNGRQDFDQRFRRAYANAICEWRELVAEQLALPASDRDPALRIGEPKPQVYIAPKLEGTTTVQPLPSLSKLLEMMPADVRSKAAMDVKRIGTIDNVKRIASANVRGERGLEKI